MVKYSQAQLDSVFHALSDPTRRTIVQEVASGPKSVSELASRFPISLPLATKHLAVLEKAGLVSTRKEGRVRTCRIETVELQDVMGWMRDLTAEPAQPGPLRRLMPCTAYVTSSPGRLLLRRRKPVGKTNAHSGVG